ncbi:putative bZIP transcription factor [Thalictrum thalictroides]|uniref:Putative bZIP transcription factor n=1 Tax=Thalictrum thalictroides TaxID=46969 RepID=A0A7J6UW34_THATH|nr:putative bZIP transcription factor [Thalictrum thalictroides]
MALALGKVTILIGAGLLGSVLAKEGGMTSASDFIFGAIKFVKLIKRDDSSPSVSKPRNDYLIAQVKDLQKQLKDLVDNRPVIIRTGGSSGLKSYGVPVFGVIVVGGAFMWWKGWKLSDMMFATKRGLADACSSVGKQLDQVSSSVSAARRVLSSRIDRVDVTLDECAELTADTKDEVSQLRGDMKVFSVDVESVHRAVQTLETKIGRIEEKQDVTTHGVRVLCDFVHTVEKGRTAASIQASPSNYSRPALITATSRTNSLPPKVLSLELPSPSSTDDTPKVKSPLQSTVSASGLKELEVLSDATMTVAKSEFRNDSSPAEDPKSNGASSSSRFGWKFPSLNASFLSRTNSATLSFNNI